MSFRGLSELGDTDHPATLPALGGSHGSSDPYARASGDVVTGQAKKINPVALGLIKAAALGATIGFSFLAFGGVMSFMGIFHSAIASHIVAGAMYFGLGAGIFIQAAHLVKSGLKGKVEWKKDFAYPAALAALGLASFGIGAIPSAHVGHVNWNALLEGLGGGLGAAYLGRSTYFYFKREKQRKVWARDFIARQGIRNDHLDMLRAGNKLRVPNSGWIWNDVIFDDMTHLEEYLDTNALDYNQKERIRDAIRTHAAAANVTPSRSGALSPAHTSSPPSPSHESPILSPSAVQGSSASITRRIAPVLLLGGTRPAL